MLNQEYWSSSSSRGNHSYNKMQIPRPMQMHHQSHSHNNRQSQSVSPQRSEFNPAASRATVTNIIPCAAAIAPISPAQSSPPLIHPKPLPNPVLESRERKELHRELLWNQRIGNNVLNNKSELQKVLQERRLHASPSSAPSNSETIPEFLKVHQRITHGSSSTNSTD